MGSVIDMDKEYARRMRKAKYQAFWIRVRFWIWDHEGRLLLAAFLTLCIMMVLIAESYK